MGYEVVDELVWVKLSAKGRLQNGLGYYLRHTKEVLLIGLKGIRLEDLNIGKFSDVIFCPRLANNEKPGEVNRRMESLFFKPGKYAELFGRENNLRRGWSTIGLFK